MKWNRSKRTSAALVLSVAVLWTANRLHAFNPQPDPPAFAALQMLATETAKLYAHCPGEAVSEVNPGPCEVMLAFRDQQGALLKGTPTSLMLRPGQTGVLEMSGSEAGRSAFSFVVVPSVLPSRGARIVPAVQVTDSFTGKTSLYSGPAAPRTSFFATQ